MPIEFEPGWDKVEAKGFEELNTEETITQLFANAKANLLSKDASDGVALASAQSVKKADTVVIVKGLHQETQVSYNKKDAERSSNFHLNIRLPERKENGTSTLLQWELEGTASARSLRFAAATRSQCPEGSP